MIEIFLLERDMRRLGLSTAVLLMLACSLLKAPVVRAEGHSIVAVGESVVGADVATGGVSHAEEAKTKPTETEFTLQTSRKIMMADNVVPTEQNQFTEVELQALIESKYSVFAKDPVFIQRIASINRNVVDFPTREFKYKAFDDERKSFIVQRHKELVLFLENYLVKNNLPNMTDVPEFVDKIEDKYFYFELKTFGSSSPADKNYYRSLLEEQVTLNEPAFNKFVRDFIKDAEIKRKKYFSDKINDYFYTQHFKEGNQYDKALQEQMTNSLVEVFSMEGSGQAKYCTTSYEKFLADKAQLSTAYTNVVNAAVEDFKRRLTQSIIPTFVSIQAAGRQLLIPDDYEQLVGQLIEPLATPAYVFSNRGNSDTDIIGKLNGSSLTFRGQDDTVVTAKKILQGYFLHSSKRIVKDSLAAISVSLTQENWDRAIGTFIKAGETDADIAQLLSTTIIHEFVRQNANKPLPFVVDTSSQLEGADSPKLMALLKDDIKAILDAWDVEAFRETLKSDLLKEVFFPGKELFLGNTPEAKARFQLLSFITMYSVYYANTPAADKRLCALFATPIKRHRQAIFEAPNNRKLAVKEFRKMARSTEGSIIARATMNELVIASALAASVYTNPANMPKAAILVLQTASLAVPPLAKFSTTTATTWKGLMSQIMSVAVQNGTSALIQSRNQQIAKPSVTTLNVPAAKAN